MSKKRTIFVVFFCGLIFPALFERVVDGEWPSYTALQLVVIVGGLVVMAIAFIAIDAYRVRRRETADISS